MAKYINREELVEWLKRIPLKDLSDGLGLCRVIMEEDFKRAIRTIPDGTIIDVAPVVRCKECKWTGGDFVCYRGVMVQHKPEDFCSYGERRGGGEDD